MHGCCVLWSNIRRMVPQAAAAAAAAVVQQQQPASLYLE
jgi:hypothetical protein